MRIAAVQCFDIPDDARRTGDAIVQRLRWADDAGVDLVVFPEAFLLGHSYDPDTIRSRAGLASAAIAGLCDRAREFRATLLVGAFEQVDGQVFNNAIIIAAGQVVGRYSKVHPNEPSVTAGSACPVFLRSGIRFGVNICNDANHPGTAQRVADQDAQLIVYPLNNMLPPETADRWRERTVTNLIDRARQTECWVISSDVTGKSGDHISYGCTAIVSPEGSVVARVPEMREGVAVYDVPAR